MIDELLKLRVERALGNWPDDASVSVRAGDLRELLAVALDAVDDVEPLERRVENLEEAVAAEQELVAETKAELALAEELL